VPFGEVEAVVVVEGGHPGKNPRMITRAMDSRLRQPVGKGRIFLYCRLTMNNPWNEE
jgi:hypothetical protein